MWEWLTGLDLLQLYALIFVIDLALNLSGMFFEDRGREFREILDDAPDWYPAWASFAVGILACVIISLMWPWYWCLTLRDWVAKAVDRYLNWRTRRWLVKTIAAMERGEVIYAISDADGSTVDVETREKDDDEQAQ